MIKVSVFYPHSDAMSFDMDYYRNSHMPMVREKLDAACKNTAIEGGLGGRAPDTPLTHAAMGHLYFDTVKYFQTSFAPHAKAIMADIPNYTDITPVIQLSEVVA